MEPRDLLPIRDPSLRRRLEELIGTVEGAAYDTRNPRYKRVLGQLAQPLGRIADETHTEEDLEPLLERYRDACMQASEVTKAEGAPVAVLYEWLGWYLATLLAGTVTEEAQALVLAETVLTLLAQS